MAMTFSGQVASQSPHCTQRLSVKRSMARSGLSDSAPVGQAVTQAWHSVQPSTSSFTVPNGAPGGSGTTSTGALSDNPDRAMLRFTESLCVQCGLCESTCPEQVIAIEPRLDFQAWNTPQRVLKEEEPFNCIACGKPFGTKSSIDRVLAKLGEKHWMFQGANARRLDVIQMCADCRVEAVVNESFDPHAAPQRPPVMTTEDYLRARNVKKDDPLGS